jgi:transcriptional regulator with XRE-family HTH domain
MTGLGTYIKREREAKGWSIRALGRESDIRDTTIMRIERGETTAPEPDILEKLAKALETPLSDLYDLAGYAIPTELPSMPAYLRTKYRDLPEPARDELNSYLEHLRQKYGLDEHGPKDGEDET